MRDKNRHPDLICGICGGPYMVKNPHPDAGKPDKVAEVGTTYVCVPCTVFTRHEWCKRALKAKAENAELRKHLKALLKDGQVWEYYDRVRRAAKQALSNKPAEREKGGDDEQAE